MNEMNRREFVLATAGGLGLVADPPLRDIAAHAVQHGGVRDDQWQDKYLRSLSIKSELEFWA
jgi:hypothetical protein